MTGPLRVYVVLTIIAILALVVVGTQQYFLLQQQVCYPTDVQLPTVAGVL